MSGWLKHAWKIALAATPAVALALAVGSDAALGSISRFMLQVAVLAAPLGVLAWFYRVFPDRNFALVAVIPAALSTMLLVNDALRWLVWGVDLAVAVIAVFDLLTLPRRDQLTVERAAGRIASLRKPHPVALTVQYRGPRSFDAVVRDGAPAGLVARPAELRHRFTPRSLAEFDYTLTADRRGAFALSRVFVQAQSRFQFWRRYLEFDVETPINVYPDLKQLSQYALLARLDRLNLLGVRRTRRVGQDNEFERLRDYTIGDNYRHIDWRSTARRRKLTVKDFQQNQSQRLIFLIDCGRMMTNRAAGITLLDHALNAALMLSYVALSHGDSVGLLCFSDAIHSYIPPQGGLPQMNRLLHASFDQFPRLVESRYDRAFLYLESHARKRSLVVLVTNVIDEVNRNQVEQYLANLTGRHLALGVLLRDRRVYDYLHAPAGAPEGLYRAAAAADILSWRQQVLTDLHTKGVLSLDVFPDELTTPLVNKYLEIKARHLL